MRDSALIEAQVTRASVGAAIASSEVTAELTETLRALHRRVEELGGQIAYLHGRARAVEELKDELAPLAKEMLRAGIDKLDAAERRGYFRVARGVFSLLDRVAAHYTEEDIEALAANLVHILDTIKNFTQPEVLAAANRVLETLSDASQKPPRRLSLWRLWRATRKPEVQQALGLAMDLLCRLGRQTTPEE